MTTITPVNVWSAPDDNTGDLWREGFIKLNTNIDNLNTDKVEWPVSSNDWGIALFDWTTWKLLKESPSSLNDFLDKTTYDPNNLAKDLFATSTEVNVDTNTWSDTTWNGSADAPFATIQKGIDSITDNSSSKRYTIKAKWGTYTENITLKSFVNLQGLWVFITGTTWPLVSFTWDQSFVLQVAFILTPTTSGQTIIASSWTWFHELNFCEFTVSTPVDVTAHIANVTGWSVLISEAITVYSQTWTSASVNTHEIFKMATGGTIRNFRSDLLVFIEDEADNVTVYADASTWGFFITQLQANINILNPSYSGTAKVFSFTGTKSFKVMSWSTIDLIWAWSWTWILIDIDSSTNDITVENFSSRTVISWFTTNLESTIATWDRLESFFNTINETDWISWSWTYQQYQLWDFFNGTVEDLVWFTASSNGTTITASVEKSWGWDLTLRYWTWRIKFKSTPAATIALTAGTDTAPVMNYVFIPQSTWVLTANTTWFPSPQHTRIGIVECKSAATDQTDWVFGIQNTVDEIQDPADNGHLSHINEWIRNQPATYVSWMTQSSTWSGTATVTLWVTSWEIFQLHKNTSPTFSDPADLYVINDFTTAFRKTTNLVTMSSDSTWNSFGTKFFALVLWQKVSSTSWNSRLYINLPSGDYNSELWARDDLNKHTNFNIPIENRNTWVLIHRYVCRIQWGNLTLFPWDWDDLRGTLPNTASWSSSSASTVFQTPTFRVQDGTDATKQIALWASNITTGTTRTYDVPDKDGTIALLDDITASAVWLGNVDNTSDANKPVSTAQQTEIDTKLDTTATAADSTKVWWITITGTPTVWQVATATGTTAATWQDAGWGGWFTSAVRAYRSASQSIPNNTDTKVQLNNESYDVDGEFDPVTNFEFTATDAGKYQVNASAYFTSMADTTFIQFFIKVNTTVVAWRSLQSSWTWGQSVNISDILDLSASDTVQLFVRQNSWIARNIGTAWFTSAETYLSIHRLS